MKKVFILLCVLLCKEGISQEQIGMPKPEGWGIGVGIVTSANSYGGRYSYMLAYRQKRTKIALGALVQSGRNNLSGFEILGVYALTGYTTPGWQKEDEYPSNLELATFVNLTYNQNAHLSSHMLIQESETCSEKGDRTSDYGFRSVEAYGGIMLKWRFLRHFKWNNSVGLGGYHTLNYPGPMYYNKNGAGLLLRSEVTFLIP